MFRKSIVLLTCLVAFTVSARAADFVVTNTNATGPGSLNAAIVAANAAPGADRITFAIPGAGLHKIDVSQTALPDITDTVTIDGYTQPGSKPNTAAIGSNAVLQIQVDGKAGGTSPVYRGFTVKAVNCILRGLMITGFDHVADGIGQEVNGYGVELLATGCRIEGNFIGTDGTNTAAFKNDPIGLWVRASNTTVGGTTPAARNVIGGGGFSYGVFLGIQVVNNHVVPLSDITISGNQIGTNPQEAGAINGKVEGAPNGTGIGANSTSKGGAVIGGTTPEEANLISGNAVGIEANDTGNCLIEGNLIGLQPDRATPVVNQIWGIEVTGVDNVIGGLAEGAGNQIAFNQVGIILRLNPKNESPTAFRDTVLSNHIYANSKIGIDLDGDGLTHNDFGDADFGSNYRQNFPVIGSVNGTSGGGTTISGGLDSTPSTKFTIQVFENLAGKRGQNLLGTQQVTTGTSGFASFQVNSPVSVSSGSTFTATATDPEGDTSEFSPQKGRTQLANISTRATVNGASYIVIGGFIIKSNQPKRVAIRALGPSLNVPNKLKDPSLELHDSSGVLIAKNDDWRSGQQQDVVNSGLAPESDVESVLITTLAAGAYTAQLRDVNNGLGTGLVEIYDLDSFSQTSGRLVNISTRSFVENDGVMIGGVIIRGDAPEHVIVRAIGLDGQVSAPLRDPTLELHDGNGALLATNDNWRDQQEAEITATGLAPKDNRDSAIVARLAPGAYTGVVRGKTSADAGQALLEFYDLTN